MKTKIKIQRGILQSREKNGRLRSREGVFQSRGKMGGFDPKKEMSPLIQRRSCLLRSWRENCFSIHVCQTSLRTIKMQDQDVKLMSFDPVHAGLLRLDPQYKR